MAGKVGGMRRPNDIGGREAGAIDTKDGNTAAWQKTLTAVVNRLGQGGHNLMRIDEFRRTREDLPGDLYDSLTYFELWTEGLRGMVIEKGILTPAEIDARMARLRKNAAGGA